MKRQLLILLLASVLTTSLWANPVNLETARRAAESFWTMNALGKWAGMVNASDKLGLDGVYLFANPAGGYVLVAADDCALPILGYSASSALGDALPENMLDWIKGYDWQISQLVQHGVQGSDEVRLKWAELLSGVAPKSALTTPVAPLVTTHWGQGDPYNRLCPAAAASQQRTATGCVATAMAQVMKYWNHPLQGRDTCNYTHPTFGLQAADFGATTYDWAHMPLTLTNANTAQEIQAVATLMYHAGVSLATNYGYASEGGSAADVIARTGITYPCVENALRQYFDYSPEVFGARLSGTDEAAWRATLRAEMDSARPVIYSGNDFSGGHCFVCDGYDSEGRFHFNWGWGGTGDGYFAIGSLNPNSVGGIGVNTTSTFNLDNVAVMGIRPAQRNNASTANVSVTLTDNAHATVTGPGVYNNFTDLVTLTVNTLDGYRFDGWSDGDLTMPRQFYANGDVHLTARIVPVVGDTIAYCVNGHVANVTNRYYGMKVMPSDLPANRSLRSVQLFNVYPGSYIVRIYTGGSNAPGTLTHEEVFHLDGTGQWETLRFSQTVSVSNAQPLWVVAYCPDNSYPAPVTTYSGNKNGGWTSLNGSSWMQMNDYTFLIRALFSQPSDVIITANSSNPLQGRATGGGRYAVGETCTLTAEPFGDNVFDHWSDGSRDNPHTVTATAYTTYTAYFSGCGISTLPLTIDFTEDLSCWTTYSASPANEPNMGIYTYSGMWGSTAYFKFCSQSVSAEYDQYLITPRLLMPNAIDLTFSYSCYSSVAETFDVAYSTTDNNPASFTHVVRSGSTTLSTWDTMRVVIPAEAKYIAFHYTTQHGYYLYIDNIQMTAVPLPQYTITATAESSSMGTVTGGGTYEQGTPVMLEAHPGACYEFVRWQDGSHQNPRVVVANADAVYTATFAQRSFLGTETLVACDSAEWNGRWYYASTSSPTRMDTTAAGCDSVTTLQLTINRSVVLDTTIVAVGECEFDGELFLSDTLLTRNLTTQAGCDSTVLVHVVITSQPQTYLISAQPCDPAMGSVSGGGEYEAGSQVELVAVPAAGYEFVAWSDSTRDNPYVFTATADLTITALFQASATEGISMAASAVKVWTAGRTLTVQGAESFALEVVDVMGRVVAGCQHPDAEWSVKLPHRGVYFVRVGQLSAIKTIAF